MRLRVSAKYCPNHQFIRLRVDLQHRILYKNLKRTIYSTDELVLKNIIMFPKKIAIFIFCFICDTCFAQDTVFHIRKKLQEKHVFDQNPEALIKDLISRGETAYQEANFDFYGDFLSGKLHSYADLRFGGKCWQDLLTVLKDMVLAERYALMSKSFSYFHSQVRIKVPWLFAVVAGR